MTAWFKRPVAVAAGCALAVAVFGGAMTKIGPWYEELTKPEWNPPNWVFGPVWTLIYGLAVLSAVRAWSACRTGRERAWLLSLFFVNAVLNVLWSAVFFTLQRPEWAMAELVTLWMSVLALVIFTGRRDRLAGAVLLPYLAWVGFAGLLNWRIVALNAPFGAG